LKAWDSEFEVWEFIAGPFQGVADVDHWARGEGDFGTKAVVDTDGEEAMREEEAGLCWSDVLAGENHVAAAVDHQGFAILAILLPVEVKCQTYRWASWQRRGSEDNRYRHESPIFPTAYIPPFPCQTAFSFPILSPEQALQASKSENQQ
jgi:hypothetical protein